MDQATRLRLGELLGTEVTGAHSHGGQHGVRHYRLLLADGRMAFAKTGNGVDGAGAARRAAAVAVSERDLAGLDRKSVV